MENNVYDVIIVGGGPCGLTAGLYAGRAKLKTLILEKFAFGGTPNITYEVKNFPGFLDISGMELMEKLREQVENLDGVELCLKEVTSYELNEKIKKINCDGVTFLGKSVILCNGASAKKLGLENEKEFLGSGISYCAICDGAFFKNEIVAVVGGGNSAFENAIYLSNIAKKVLIFNRTKDLRADKTLIESAKDKKNIEILFNSQVVKINGNNKLESVDVKTVNEIKNIKIAGLFISIGRIPETENMPKNLKLTASNHICINQNLETNISGVYAGGDIRENSLGQIISACADGALTSTKANQYLRFNKEI